MHVNYALHLKSWTLGLIWGHFPKYRSIAAGGPTTTANCDLATHCHQWPTGGVLWDRTRQICHWNTLCNRLRQSELPFGRQCNFWKVILLLISGQWRVGLKSVKFMCKCISNPTSRVTMITCLKCGFYKSWQMNKCDTKYTWISMSNELGK